MYGYAIYGREWNKDSPSIIIDSRPLTNTRYSTRFNHIETESGTDYVPLILIQCGRRTSREEGIALAERICELLNKEPT